jgi:hypothetical protein
MKTSSRVTGEYDMTDRFKERALTAFLARKGYH